jgi:hypothetical protein
MTPPDFGLSIIASWIANKIDKSLNKSDRVYVPVTPNTSSLNINPPIIEKETESMLLAKRFQKLIDLMNENRSEYNKFTIANLSEILSLEKRSILDNIVTGYTEPTFDFIKQFCHTFRINYDWLNEGKGNPFEVSYLYYSPMDYLEDIIKLNPERIYLIQNKSDVAETFIMLGFSDWYYMVCTKIWHISNHVGAGGQSQIYDLYRLIKELKSNMFYLKCYGLKLDSKEFFAIFYGKKFPGSCLVGEMGFRGNHPWWDDFIDIYHTFPIADDYLKLHGKSFIDAQEIVKQQIQKRETYTSDQ